MNKAALHRIITADDYGWIKVRRYAKPNQRWISVEERLPEFGDVCEIVIKDRARDAYEEPYEFVQGVGVSNNRNAFQLAGLNAMGLYEMAFFVDEELVTHWRPHAYDALEMHHREETEFLISKCRELAKQLLECGRGE